MNGPISAMASGFTKTQPIPVGPAILWAEIAIKSAPILSKKILSCGAL